MYRQLVFRWFIETNSSGRAVKPITFIHGSLHLQNRANQRNGLKIYRYCPLAASPDPLNKNIIGKLNYIKKVPHTSPANYQSKVAILQKHFGVSRSEASKLIKSSEKLMKSSVEHFQLISSTMEGLSLMQEDANSTLLFTLDPPELRHAYLFLKECELPNITASMILRCPILMDGTPELLSDFLGIVNSQRVEVCWVATFPQELKIETLTMLNNMGYKATVSELRNVVIAKYLAFQLNTPFSEVRPAVEKGLANAVRSVKCLKETIDFLLSSGFDKRMILDHPHILNWDVHGMKELFQRYPFFTQPFHWPVLLEHPDVCRNDFFKVRDGISTMKQYGLKDTAVEANLHLLPLGRSDLLEKLSCIDSQTAAEKVLGNLNGTRRILRTHKRIIIQNALGVTAGRINSLLNHSPKWLKELTLNQLKEVSATLGTLKIHDLDSVDGVLLFSLTPCVIRRYYSFLQELDIKITARLLYGCPRLLKLKIPAFRMHTKLEQDVAQSWIQCFPDPIRDEMKTLINQQVNFKLMTIGEIQRLLMAKYLCWKLDFDWPQAKNAVTSSLYDFCQNIKSFIETIDILMEIGLKKEHILGYSRLLRSDSTSLRKLIDTYPRFLGDEIGPVLMRHPVLCTFNFDNMEQNLKQLSYVKFPVSTLIRHLDLLNEEPWQLREKLIHIERYPEMRVLCHNPRFPEVFKNIETATLRLEALRSVNQRNISLKAINQCNNSSYLKMIQENDQRREVNLEAKRYLVNLLNRSPKEIRNALRSHPHWDQLDLTNMILVVEFLQEHQFSAEQIFNGIQLVLYPLSEVARGMTEFISELDQSTILMKIKPAKRLNPHVLQLLLYIIERKSHFSGNSVLSNDDQTVGV